MLSNASKSVQYFSFHVGIDVLKIFISKIGQRSYRFPIMSIDFAMESVKCAIKSIEQTRDGHDIIISSQELFFLGLGINRLSSCYHCAVSNVKRMKLYLEKVENEYISANKAP